MSHQRKTAIRLGLFLATCFSAWLILLHLAGGKLVPGQHGYRVEALVPNALSLTRHADVRQAGVRIGEVDDLRGTGTTTAFVLDLDRAHAPVYRDARVYVRAKSIAGENYLELDPGTPAGRSGPRRRTPPDRSRPRGNAARRHPLGPRPPPSPPAAARAGRPRQRPRPSRRRSQPAARNIIGGHRRRCPSGRHAGKATGRRRQPG